MGKCLTIRDLSKADLVEIIETFIEADPCMARVFSDENLAATIAGRKIQELKRLEKKISAYQEAIRKARGEKKKNTIGREALPKVKRYNQLVDQVRDFKERFPQIFQQKEASNGQGS